MTTVLRAVPLCPTVLDTVGSVYGSVALHEADLSAGQFSYLSGVRQGHDQLMGHRAPTQLGFWVRGPFTLSWLAGILIHAKKKMCRGEKQASHRPADLSRERGILGACPMGLVRG